MPNEIEIVACHIVSDLYTYRRGRPQPWAPLYTITSRLVLIDEKAIEAAIELAVGRGWLLVDDSQSICLTDAGRDVATHETFNGIRRSR